MLILLWPQFLLILNNSLKNEDFDKYPNQKEKILKNLKLKVVILYIFQTQNLMYPKDFDLTINVPN